jgi:hypothetical protein
MPTLEKLHTIAQTLTNEQLAAMIVYAKQMRAAPVLHRAPQYVRDSVVRGVADVRAKRTVSSATLFKKMRSKNRTTN